MNDQIEVPAGDLLNCAAKARAFILKERTRRRLVFLSWANPYYSKNYYRTRWWQFWRQENPLSSELLYFTIREDNFHKYPIRDEEILEFSKIDPQVLIANTLTDHPAGHTGRGPLNSFHTYLNFQREYLNLADFYIARARQMPTGGTEFVDIKNYGYLMSLAQMEDLL